MKKGFLFIYGILICTMLCSCINEAASIGIIGGSDGPTAIFVGKKQTSDKKLFKSYINERKLEKPPVQPEREYSSDDRKLILDDKLENEIELFIYQYYKDKTDGNFEKIQSYVLGEQLKAAIENDQKNFDDGKYYSHIIIDEIDIADKDELFDIYPNTREQIANILDSLNIKEFAIAEVEKTVILNEKYQASAPQIGNGEASRYYIVGKDKGEFKICQIYWEGILD